MTSTTNTGSGERPVRYEEQLRALQEKTGGYRSRGQRPAGRPRETGEDGSERPIFWTAKGFSGYRAFYCGQPPAGNHREALEVVTDAHVVVLSLGC